MACKPLQIVRTSLLIVATLAMAACAARGVIESMDRDKLIEGMEKRAYLVDRFRADFTQTRRKPAFARDLVVQGRLVFEKPSSFRLTIIGDVNLEIVSDGKTVQVVHDLRDQEIHQMQGSSGLSRLADPLVLLLDHVGNGGMRGYSIVQKEIEGESLVLEIKPENSATLELVQSAYLSFSQQGDLTKVTIMYKDGGMDETVFTSWAAVASDDPDIVLLRRRLEGLPDTADPAARGGRRECASCLKQDYFFPSPIHEANGAQQGAVNNSGQRRSQPGKNN
ncbi:MAG: outer membrane lipoprotein carrier protein LolA [Thermodesulfobacteriota bacterium]